MVTKMMTRKSEVVIPTEPTQICKWTDEMIKSSVNPNDDNGGLLSQDLFSASKDIYMSNKIETLGQLQTSFFDEESKSLIKNNKSGADPSVTRRFIVDIGHNKYHDNNFSQRRTYKSETEYHQTFRTMIETHYQWCFDTSEAEFIKRALDRDNVCHIVIYNRYYHKLTRNKNQVEPYYFVAAAASFILSDSCSVLLYMGVSGDLFYPKMDYATPLDLGNKKIRNQECYRQQDFGAYMISMIQKMTYCALGRHTIVAQVKNHSTHGAIYFYLKTYFKIIHGDDNIIYEINEKFDDIFQDAPGLVYMISRCALYHIYPNYMKNVINVGSMSDAIIHGAKVILNIDLEKESNRSWSFANELNTVFTKLHNDGMAFLCYMTDTDTNRISLTQEPVVTNEGKEDTLIFPNIQFWDKRFLPSNDLVILPSVEINNNYNYRVMAIILFQDEQRYTDIRCFFYYFMQCLEFMSTENCIIYNTDIPSKKNSNAEKVINLQKQIWSTILLCEQLYNTSDLKKYNVPGKKNDPFETFTSNDLYNAIGYIKQKQLSPSYPGTNLEWSLFCLIFNVDLHLFHAYSYEKQGLDLSDPLAPKRKWIVQEKKHQESNNAISVFKINNTQRSVIKCSCIVYEDKYLLVGNSDIIRQLEYQETIINLKISQWINNLKDKVFFPGLGVIEEHPFRILKESFNYSDYTDSSVSIKKRYLCVMIIDPLKDFLIKAINYVSSNTMKTLDYLTLRPTTYISSAVIDHYITYICNEYKETKALIVQVGQLHSYVNNEKFRSEFDIKIRDYKHIICPICVQNFHWITMEFKLSGKKIHPWIFSSPIAIVLIMKIFS